MKVEQFPIPLFPRATLAVLSALALVSACGGGHTDEASSSDAPMSTQAASTPEAATAAALQIDESRAAALLQEVAAGDADVDAGASSSRATGPAASRSPRVPKLYDQILACMQAYVDAHNLISVDNLGPNQRFDGCSVVGAYRGTMRLGYNGSKFSVRDTNVLQDPPLSCRVWHLPGGLTVGTVGHRVWTRWEDSPFVLAALSLDRSRMTLGTLTPQDLTPLVQRTPGSITEVQFCQGEVKP